MSKDGYVLFRNKRGRKMLNTDDPFLTLSIHRSKSTTKHQLFINHTAIERLGNPQYLNVWYNEQNRRIKIRGISKQDPHARKVMVAPHGRLWSVSVTGLCFILPAGRYKAINTEEFGYEGESYYEPTGEFET